MFQESEEGKTHYENDGCGEPAHNLVNQSISEELEKIECSVRWKEGFMPIVCGHPYPCPKHTDRKDFIEWLQSKISQALTARDKHWMKRIREEVPYCSKAYGPDGIDTFPDCGKCVVCEAKALLGEK